MGDSLAALAQRIWGLLLLFDPDLWRTGGDWVILATLPGIGEQLSCKATEHELLLADEHRRSQCLLCSRKHPGDCRQGLLRDL